MGYYTNVCKYMCMINEKIKEWILFSNNVFQSESSYEQMHLPLKCRQRIKYDRK